MTSNLAKSIERVSHTGISKFIEEKSILSPLSNRAQGRSFNMKCSCCFRESYTAGTTAHKYAALVTLDTARAYDTVEHGILIGQLENPRFSGAHSNVDSRILYGREVLPL